MIFIGGKVVQMMNGKKEIISRVFQMKEDAIKLKNECTIHNNAINPRVKMNNSKTGWYVCYYSSWNQYRIKEWYEWLKGKGVKCYLVKS